MAYLFLTIGGWHSAAVSIDGDLYTWGWNGNGQLGLSSQNAASVSVMATPQVVDIQNYSNKVLKVSCGNRHTITLLGRYILFYIKIIFVDRKL